MRNMLLFLQKNPAKGPQKGLKKLQLYSLIMVFRTDLNLELMKKIVGWEDDQPFQHMIDDERHINEENPVVPCLYTFGKVMDPEDSVAEIVEVLDHIKTHYIRIWKKYLSEHGVKGIYPSSGLLSEPVSNLLTHGGRGVAEAETLVEHYHPTDYMKFIIRITNPEAAEWDYERMVREEKGMGGFDTFRDLRYNVSYDDGGRTFLALVDIPRCMSEHGIVFL